VLSVLLARRGSLKLAVSSSRPLVAITER
jgi:hypothetical protein